MQTLEWAFCGRHLVKSIVAIACGASHTAWQIAISETQRQAIYADPKWQGGRFAAADPPTTGVSVARQIAMVSYRTAQAFERKFGRREIALAHDKEIPTKVGLDGAPYWDTKSYLEYQGQKFLERGFDA